MSLDQLAIHKRMRACLVGIVDLDPTGVGRRIEEIDREIAYLEALLGPGKAHSDGQGSTPMPQAPLRASVKVA